MDREALYIRIFAWPFRHRPRDEDPANFQTEVIVETPSPVFLDREPGSRGSGPRRRFGDDWGGHAIRPRSRQVSALLDCLDCNARGLNLFGLLTAPRASLGFPSPGRTDGAENAAAAARTVKSPPTVRHMHRASAMPSDRIAQALPSARVLTVITADPAATFGVRSSTEDRREHPIDAWTWRLEFAGRNKCVYSTRTLVDFFRWTNSIQIPSRSFTKASRQPPIVPGRTTTSTPFSSNLLTAS